MIVERELAVLLELERSKRNTYIGYVRLPADECPDWMRHSNYEVPAWVAEELCVMLRAVNTYRSKMDKEPVSMREIIDAESSAHGKPNPLRSFAHACAELAVR